MSVTIDNHYDSNQSTGTLRTTCDPVEVNYRLWILGTALTTVKGGHTQTLCTVRVGFDTEEQE